MENTKENQGKKKMNISSSSKGNQQKNNKTNNTDLSQKDSSNVGKGPAGENL